MIGDDLKVRLDFGSHPELWAEVFITGPDLLDLFKRLVDSLSKTDLEALLEQVLADAQQVRRENQRVTSDPVPFKGKAGQSDE